MDSKAVELMSTVLGNEEVAVRVCACISNSSKYPTKDELKRINGVTDRRANIVMACMELSAMYIVGTDSKNFDKPEDVARRFCYLKYEKQERFMIMTLDSSNHEIGVHELTIGLVDRTPVHPREAFAFAVTDRAVSVIFVHNHPSGNTMPSQEDFAITRVLCAAGNIMQIPVIDHIIVGMTGYTSMCRESPEIFEKCLPENGAEAKWQTA